MPDEFSQNQQGADFSDRTDDELYGQPPDFVKRRGRYRRSALSRVFFSLFLIAAGTLLFLGNVGILPIQDVWMYWPLILVAFGVARLFSCRSAAGVITGLFLIVFGALFLLISLGVFQVNFHDKSWPLALLLITFGFLALAKTLEGNQGLASRTRFPRRGVVGAENALNENVVFGGVKRRIETTEFAGGIVHSVFGSVEVDLRRAQLPASEKQAIVNVHAVFASVKMRVPETWRVSIQGAGVFGTYEDKTIPPRASDGFEAPALVITGTSVFSAVEIEN